MSAYAHQLFLDVPHTNNPRIIRLMDASIYTNKLPVNCGILQITCPGFNTPVTIDVSANFNLVGFCLIKVLQALTNDALALFCFVKFDNP